MTKAEIKTALETKFYRVGDWFGGFPDILGIARYDIVVFERTANKSGGKSYSVFLEVKTQQ